MFTLKVGANTESSLPARKILGFGADGTIDGSIFCKSIESSPCFALSSPFPDLL